MKWIKSPGLWIQEQDMHRKHLSFSQRVQLYNFIKTIGEAKGEYWEYKEGWSDAKVAEKFQVSHGNVVSVRAELGRLQTYSGAPYAVKLKNLEAKVATLEKALTEDIAKYGDARGKIEELGNKLKDLEGKINKLSLREHFRA